MQIENVWLHRRKVQKSFENQHFFQDHFKSNNTRKRLVQQILEWNHKVAHFYIPKFQPLLVILLPILIWPSIIANEKFEMIWFRCVRIHLLQLLKLSTHTHNKMNEILNSLLQPQIKSEPIINLIWVLRCGANVGVQYLRQNSNAIESKPHIHTAHLYIVHCAQKC